MKVRVGFRTFSEGHTLGTATLHATLSVTWDTNQTADEEIEREARVIIKDMLASSEIALSRYD